MIRTTDAGQIYDAADAVISHGLSQIEEWAESMWWRCAAAVRVEINPLAVIEIRHGADIRAPSPMPRQRPKGAIENR